MTHYEENLEIFTRSVCSYQSYDYRDHKEVFAGLEALEVINEFEGLEYARSIHIKRLIDKQEDCAVRSAYTRKLLLELLEMQKENHNA